MLLPLACLSHVFVWIQPWKGSLLYCVVVFRSKFGISISGLGGGPDTQFVCTVPVTIWVRGVKCFCALFCIRRLLTIWPRVSRSFCTNDFRKVEFRYLSVLIKTQERWQNTLVSRLISKILIIQIHLVLFVLWIFESENSFLVHLWCLSCMALAVMVEPYGGRFESEIPIRLAYWSILFLNSVDSL